MGKIILFYKYVTLENPQSVANNQRQLCQKLSLKGRVLLAEEGINATLGGTDEAIEAYKEAMLHDPHFFDVDFKESEGDKDHFPRLKVIVKKEILNTGLSHYHVDMQQTGTYLTPAEAHALMEQNPDDLIIFDARNNYESRIGRFQNAKLPNTDHFRDLPSYFDEHLEEFKDKQVLMSCTGGIRCEKASAYLRMKNIVKAVYHIKGGIHRYTEAFPDGFFKGKNYVFDGRISQKITDDILGSCDHCAIPYDEYSNCINAQCNKQIIVCEPCITTYHNTCSERCKQLVETSAVNVRTLPHKILIKNTK